ncbi:MAG: hypothetical protein JWR26_2315 [Pedosphaera sp.]|nr:hypothetical protein [Pedosphaera sp.]
MKEGKRWLVVVAYAVAMAWVESAVVFYLRTMIGRIDPHQVNPLPRVAGLSSVELVREFATLVMLLTVGLVAGRNWRSRLGYTVIAFGVWDIFYYVFLKIICQWPNSLMDWDILFLLPLPWWGPVLAPMMIAGLMIVWGTLASQGEHFDRPFRSEWKAWLLNFLGIGLALYVFMTDALHAAPQGPDAVRQLLPTWFNWPLFLIALTLMGAPVLDLVLRMRQKRIVPSPNLNQGVPG